MRLSFYLLTVQTNSLYIRLKLYFIIESSFLLKEYLNIYVLIESVFPFNEFYVMRIQINQTPKYVWVNMNPHQMIILNQTV